MALAVARIDPARAEQIAGSLLRLPRRELGELALALAPDDVTRAERIAAAITDDYLRALVRATLAVQAALDTAGRVAVERGRAGG